MKVCEKCNTEYEDDYIFCLYCGKTLATLKNTNSIEEENQKKIQLHHWGSSLRNAL